MALTGRAAALALFGALVVGLFAPNVWGLTVVEGSLLIAIIVDLLCAAPVKGLTFTRSGDTSVRLGEQASVALRLHNPSRRPLRALVRDAWPPSTRPPGASDGLSRHRVRIPGGESRQLRTELVPSRRGDRHPDRVTVRSHGPIGLAARQRSHQVPWRLRVLPPFGSRKHLPARLARLHELDGRTSLLTRGEGTEFDSLRTYLPGDEIRSIDWRATARRSEVAVRTWRPERDRHVVLVLDTGRTSAGRVADAPRLDAALDAALLLAALADRAGDHVHLLAHDRHLRSHVSGRGIGHALPGITEAMALLEPALVESDARAMANSVLRAAPRHALVVLLTGLDSAPTEEGLLPVLPQLTRRHKLIVAAVSDPRVDELAAGRGTAQAVYAAAAAEKCRSDRRRCADRLARYGVTVLDAPPEELPPRLADTYLELKASGRL